MRKKITMLLLAFAVIIMIQIPAKEVKAATKSMTPETWMEVTSTDTYYKFVTEKEGFVTLSAKCANGIYVELLDSKKRAVEGTKGYGVLFSFSEDFVSTKRLAVSPGTYYIHAAEVNETGYISYKFTEVKQPLNFSAPKALTWEKNKTKTICITQKYSFHHWYKIKLTEAQKIAFVCYDSDAYGASFYKSSGTQVFTSISITSSGSNYNIYKTSKTFPAGTYYIRFDRPELTYQTYYNRIKWK